MIRYLLLLALLPAPVMQPAAARSGSDDDTAEQLRKLLELRDKLNAQEAQRYARKAHATARKGVDYLIAQQDDKGGWATETGPGISALVVRALVRQPGIGPKHAAVQRGVEFVLTHQRDDGGIYSAEGIIKNYETSLALSMLSALGDKRHAKAIERAQKFLAELQWDEGEEKSIDDVFYGGAGYGRSKRPDLSNTQMMLDALHDSGLPKDHPAYKKALVFISRCQMLGERNDQPYAKGSTQGGFIYSPANGGESKAGKIQVNNREELRCYGSMTYAGYKSMLYAGLSKDDPRVRAAFEWMQRHWTLDHNPNLPAPSKQGLFYYYQTLGRALAAYGAPTIRDQYNREHHWKRELTDKLAELQKSDGSWVNEADRWMEGIPALTTGYAILALQEAYPGNDGSAAKKQ